MKRILTVAAVLMLALPALAQKDDFTRLCEKYAQEKSVEFLSLDGGFFKMARAFMSKEEKALFKALRINALEVLILEKCDAPLRGRIFKEARELLDGPSFIKSPEQFDGNDTYFVKGADEGSLKAMIIVMDGPQTPSLCRMCGDIRKENLENLTL